MCPCILDTPGRGGYDGRSQVRLAAGGDAASSWASLTGTADSVRPAVAEQALDLESELSVMIARAPNGSTAVFPPALNFHERQVLAWSVIPAPLPETLVKQAIELARGIADAIELEGLLAVEMFLNTGGELLVNELAPRPHQGDDSEHAEYEHRRHEPVIKRRKRADRHASPAPPGDKHDQKRKGHQRAENDPYHSVLLSVVSGSVSSCVAGGGQGRTPYARWTSSSATVPISRNGLRRLDTGRNGCEPSSFRVASSVRSR